MKRTTLILEDAILEGVRETAHRRGTDMSSVVNEWLATGLQQERKPAEVNSRKLPTFRMGKPRVDLADRDQLEQWMEES